MAGHELYQVNRNFAMKKAALVTICLLCSIVLLAQDIDGFVYKQLQTYPQLRLLDQSIVRHTIHTIG